MIEDKLEHDERVRLECLAQAIAMGRHTAAPDQIVASAMIFQKYVMTGERS